MRFFVAGWATTTLRRRASLGLGYLCSLVHADRPDGPSPTVSQPQASLSGWVAVQAFCTLCSHLCGRWLP